MTFTNSFTENTQLDVFNYINMLTPKRETYGKINIHIDDKDVFTYGPNVSSTEKLNIISFGGKYNITTNNDVVTTNFVSHYSGFIGRLNIHKNIIIDNYSMCKKINCDVLFNQNEKNKYYEIEFTNKTNITINTKIETKDQPELLESDSKIDKQTKIQDYFNNLENKNIKYELPKKIKLQYHSDNYYTNINNNYSKYICFLININNSNYKNISNLKFLNTELINQTLDKYNNLWLLKIGIRTPEESFIKYCKHNVYFIIYKKEDNTYNYKQLDYDIKGIYDLQYDLTILKYVDKKMLNNNLKIKLNNKFEDKIFDYKPVLNLNSDNRNLSIKFNNFINHVYLKSNSFDVKNIDILQVMSYDCAFEPRGSTISECKQECYNDIKNNNCNIDNCNQKCENCKNLQCKWNSYDFLKNDLLTPSSTKIRGFSGNKMVKLTWLKPITESDIINYYIIKVTNCPSILDESKCPQNMCSWTNGTCMYNNNNIEVIKYINNEEILEHYVKNLLNNISYTFYIISKNEYGISNISNKVTLIPNPNSKMFIDKSAPYDNSLQELYKHHNSTMVKTPPNIKQIINTSLKNDLKDILIDKSIKENTLSRNYGINIL